MQTPAPKRSLYEWLDYLGWSQAELARQARIDVKTAAKALEGDASLRTKKAIAEAINRSSPYDVNVGDIQWN